MGVLINNDPVLKINKHPILIDHETQTVLDLKPGESLAAFLHRHIDNMDGQPMVVHVGGKVVKRELWAHVFPKQNQTIAVRFGVQKTALLIIALVVLSIFTMGAAAAVAAGAATATGIGAGFAAGLAAAGLSATASMAVIGAIQVVGAMIINKVLGPKPPKPPSIERDSVYNISGTRNSVRQFEPVGLLFGSLRVTPDVVTIPYTWYQNNDQYLGMVLSPGINVDRVDTLYIGDTQMDTYQGVQKWFSGFSGMAEDVIPLFTNVDTTAGGKLEAEFNVPGPWIVRTTSLNTLRIQIDLSYLLFDLTSKGKKKNNQERLQIEYRLPTEPVWQPAPYQPYLVSDSQTEQRRTYSWEVPEGQYEVRIRRMGQHTDGKGATCEMNWASLLSIQADRGDYRGISRIGVQLKATGQLSGSPDEVRAIMHARTMPFWNGVAWVDATVENGGLSNPGAQVLKYARGFYDNNGKLIAGMGLPDSQIDIESFKEFMDHCRLRGFTYNQWLTDGRTHDEIVSTIMLAGMGRYSWSPGRFTALWAWEGQGHEGVATMANIKKGQFQLDYTLMQAADGIEYTYLDGVTWEPKTLRVPAPGVTTMTNPAKLSGEGITTEAHAAILARYHMAQNIYQFKDIVFSMDMEYMSFGQMSIIQLSHDLTQWGFSGRLLEASRDAQGRVTLRFDEPVPAPSNPNEAFVGLRIPGEAGYRVFGIVGFSGTRDTVMLKTTWPADAAFPGATAANPVYDTIYLYDFKETPGLRCRVTGIQPGEDLSGASISVVPEGDEFWNYVKSGEYIPPVGGSLLRPQPTVTNLRVREERVVQGDTVFSQFNANWNITGYAKYVVVTFGRDGQPPEEVARTSGLSASWRVNDPGLYIVTVRPYDDNDIPGVAQTLVYQAYGANQPPVNVDLFFVDEVPGGVRKYSWGWYADTIQSPDYAGVEIRYVEGSVGTPDWNTMIPLSLDGDTGEPGFHTTPFQSTTPVAGQWTFGIRTRNTSGVLSDTMMTLQKVLAYNLGERFVEVDQILSRHEESLLEHVVDIEENSLAIVKQAQAQYNIQDEQRAHRAYIARLDEVKVDETGARAIATEIVSASVGDLRAAVQTNSEAIAGIDGRLSATWSVKAQITENGKYHLAGISVGVYQDGEVIQKEVIVLANMFEILSDDAFGNVYRPFRVENGVVFINSAMIKDGEITNAKIGDVLQSKNFVWNPAGNQYAGWQLDKNGSMKLAGDVTIRGTVFADSLTGLLQRSTNWAWDGYLSPDTGGVTPNFVLDAPTRPGDTHVPLFTIELTLDNGGDHSRDGVVTVERAVGENQWQTVRQKTFTMAASTNTAQLMIVRDAPTAVANTYRIRISRGTNRWGSWSFRGVYITMQGVR